MAYLSGNEINSPLWVYSLSGELTISMKISRKLQTSLCVTSNWNRTKYHFINKHQLQFSLFTSIKLYQFSTFHSLTFSFSLHISTHLFMNIFSVCVLTFSRFKYNQSLQCCMSWKRKRELYNYLSQFYFEFRISLLYSSTSIYSMYQTHFGINSTMKHVHCQ
jgi:hypothetical protein